MNLDTTLLDNNACIQTYLPVTVCEDTGGQQQVLATNIM